MQHREETGQISNFTGFPEITICLINNESTSYSSLLLLLLGNSIDNLAVFQFDDFALIWLIILTSLV